MAHLTENPLLLMGLEMMGVIGYELKAEEGIGYETTNEFPAKSGLTK